MKTTNTILLSFLSLFSVNCAGPADPQSDLLTAEVADTAAPSACYDGTVLPRPSQQPTPNASVAARFDAWLEEMSAYELVAAAYNEEAAIHARAFNEAAGDVVGRDCSSDAECMTGSADFVGWCRIYYNVGQCNVNDLHPLATGPQAPPQPVLTCADFTCNATYQCELEESTGGVACVLQRCSGKDSGGDSGGGDGGGHGNRGGR